MISKTVVPSMGATGDDVFTGNAAFTLTEQRCLLIEELRKNTQRSLGKSQ